MTILERLAWEDGLRAGAGVVVWWGYGSGFRARGRGVIEAVFPKSFRVRLTEEGHGGSGGGQVTWPAGFVLKGIPRVVAGRVWHPNLCVEPEREGPVGEGGTPQPPPGREATR